MYEQQRSVSKPYEMRTVVSLHRTTLKHLAPQVMDCDRPMHLACMMPQPESINSAALHLKASGYGLKNAWEALAHRPQQHCPFVSR